MHHHTHEWTFNLYSVIYTACTTVQGGIFLSHFTLTLNPVTKYFYLTLCILEFKFCIFEGQANLIFFS